VTDLSMQTLTYINVLGSYVHITDKLTGLFLLYFRKNCL
jgi:hypothetical protein